MSGDPGGMQSTEATPRKQRLLGKPMTKTMLAVVAGFGLILSISDVQKILRLAQKIEIPFLVLAFIAAILSYLFIGLALRRLLDLVGERLSFKEMFAISWVSTSVNYLISTGGVGGLTMRVFLLRKKDISFSETFLVSFVHNFMINGVLIGFVMFGFGYLLTNKGLRFYHHLTSGIVLAITLTLSLLATGSVINKAFRERFIDFFYGVINRISVKFTQKTVFQEASLAEFKEEFHQGISLMLSRKRDMVLPLLYVFLDWLGCLITLYLSFITIGYPISPGVLLVGFAVGIFVSIISFIPGAIGIMEGSMAAIYYSLAVPLEVAIVAVLLYRIVYYVFPFLTSIVLYYPLFKEAKAMKISEVPYTAPNTAEAFSSKSNTPPRREFP